MAWVLKWIGFLVTIAFRALLGAAGRGSDDGGGGPDTTSFILAHPSGTKSNTNDQVGWAFSVSSPVTAVGGRIYGNAVGTERLRLWRASDQELLATVDIVTAVGEWVQASFASPVELSTEETYAVTMRRSPGAVRSRRYAAASGFTFSSFVTHGGSATTASDAFPSILSGNTLLQGFTDLIVTVPEE